MLHTDDTTVIEVGREDDKLDKGQSEATETNGDAIEANKGHPHGKVTESKTDTEGNTNAIVKKMNAFGEVKTSRYSQREKPPLPKCIFKRKKGSVRTTHFSQCIHFVDPVAIGYFYNVLGACLLPGWRVYLNVFFFLRVVTKVKKCIC